jgi:hypothetical protein
MNLPYSEIYGKEANKDVTDQQHWRFLQGSTFSREAELVVS